MLAWFRGKRRPEKNSPTIPAIFQCTIPRQTRRKNPQKFLESRGRTNRVFGKPCFCPLPKRGRFDENGENDEFAFYPLKTRVWLLKPPENDENDENGGCHSGKGMV